VEKEFDSYALELNLDIEQLHLDIASSETIAKIRNDQRGGNSAGVLSTPSVFINGKLLNRPNATRIRNAVKEAASLSG
jgi:protein-disulfide isomerase